MANRRDFLKLGAATAGVALAGGSALSTARKLPLAGGRDFSPTTGAERAAVPSACWQCVTRDGIVGYVEDGRLVKIEGNPNSALRGTAKDLW